MFNASGAFNRFHLLFLLVCSFLGMAVETSGQNPPGPGGRLPAQAEFSAPVRVEVSVRETNGEPIADGALVRLYTNIGTSLTSATQDGSTATFPNISPGEYEIEVQSMGYKTAVEHVSVQGGASRANFYVYMQREDESLPSASPSHAPIMTPKLQGEIDKGLQKLRKQQYEEALHSFEKAAKIAPGNPDVQYLMGMAFYSMQQLAAARGKFEAALAIYPSHERALLALGELQLRSRQAEQAVQTLEKASQAYGADWRVHLLLANAYFATKNYEQAEMHASRTAELNKQKGSAVRLIQARILAARGRKDEAKSAFEQVVRDFPNDSAATTARAQLAELGKRDSQSALEEKLGHSFPPLIIPPLDLPTADTSLPLASNWLPPGLDEKVPPVEPGAACALDDVLQKAGKRIQEFVRNVDRYTATESLDHESINKSGFASSPQTRKFDYVVSMEEVRPGILNVEEYRGRKGSVAEFPDGVATNGLPSLVLIFHPYLAVNFEMTCEGLARRNGALAWQLHFRQRSDKPNLVRWYRITANGLSYPVALKGRAWIAADSYQILRLETDLIAPVPQILLATDRTVIEYGPVHFREGKVDMWLPQSADVYYDWRGRRSHRRHSFSNYLLFSVGDKQHISAPKIEADSSSNPAIEAIKPKP